MTKKCTLSLLVVFALCLALTGCGCSAEQREEYTVSDAGSAENGSGQNGGENTDSSTGRNTGKNTGSSIGKNIGNSTGRNTGKNTGSSTGRNTGKNTGKNTNRKTDKKTAQNTEKDVDNKSVQSTGTIIAQNTSSSGSNSDGSSGQNGAENTDSSSNQNAGSGSDGSGGGSTTPVQRNKVITGVAKIGDITVEYGTAKEAAAAKLPGTVVLNCKDGSAIRGSVASWEVASSYNATPGKQTAYTATGEVTIPAGCRTDGGKTLKAEAGIIVRGGNTTIKSIKAPDGIEVEYDTDEKEAMKRLPSEVLLKCFEGNAVGTVTWSRKSGEAYNANPTAEPAKTVYTGTVTLPSGYQLKSGVKATIETTITVVEAGVTPKKKIVRTNCITIEISIPYTKNRDEIKANLPEKIRLVCEDGSLITVPVKDTLWNCYETYGWIPEEYNACCEGRYPYNSITLPDGYELESSIASEVPAATIYIKKRDHTKLQAALEAAHQQEARIAAGEESAVDNGKIYLAEDNVEENKVTSGVKFIWKSSDEGSKLTKFQETLTSEFKSWYTNNNLDEYDLNANQASVDTRAEELNEQTAEIKQILDSKYKTGTGFTNLSLAKNVRQMLESESFKKGNNYAYDPANYPMKLGKTYYLPQYVTVVVDEKGRKGRVELAWEVSGNPAAGLEINKTNDQGTKLSNAEVTPKDIKDNKPYSLSCKVSIVGYQGDSDWVDLPQEQKVECYDNCLVGSPISVTQTKVGEDNEDLNAGEEGRFSVRAFFLDSRSRNLVEKIDPDKITVEIRKLNYWEPDNERPLLKDIKVTEASREGSTVYGYKFTMTATAEELPAVVDPDDELAKGRVLLSIPAGAITLTDDAIKQGWYIPENGLNPGSDVDVLVYVKIPVINVTEVKITYTTFVNITFSAKNWKGSSDVMVALVRSDWNPYYGEKNYKDAAKSDPVSVDSDEEYQAGICIEDLYGKDKVRFNVWVKVGDGDWQQSKKEDINLSTASTTAMRAGLASSLALEVPAVTVESAQLSEDKSLVTVAFCTAHCSGSSVQTALVPNTLDAFDGTAAGSFVSTDAVAVEADGTYTADISASGIPAGDYIVWVKTGDGDWQKSTVIYTHTDAGTDTGAESGTDTGANNGAESGTDTGSNNGAESGTDAGANSGAESGTDANPTEGAGGSQVGLVPENEIKPETEEDTPAVPNENTQTDAQSNSAGTDGSGE